MPRMKSTVAAFLGAPVALTAWLLTVAFSASVFGGALDQPPCQSHVIVSHKDLHASSLDMDGDVLVVGDTTGIQDKSYAFVYRFDGQTWVPEQALTSGVIIGENTFGVSVAVEGDVIAVGDDNVNLIDGAAYIFRYDGSKWNKTQTLDQPEDNANKFGAALAMEASFLSSAHITTSFRIKSAAWARLTFIRTTATSSN